MYHQILSLYYKLILTAYFNDMHYLSFEKKKKWQLYIMKPSPPQILLIFL